MRICGSCRRAWGASLAIFCLFGTAAFADSFDAAQVEQAIEQREFPRARQLLEQRLQAAPNDFRAHMLLGIVLDEQNDPADAESHLAKAVELQPRSAAAHINFGKHAARAGQLARATQEFEAAIRLAPGEPSGHTNLGLLLLAQGKNSAALVQLQTAAAQSPRDVALRLSLFECQLRLKQFPEARATAAAILSLSPPSAVLLGRVGARQAQAGDYAGAIPHLERSLALDSRDGETRYDLGLAYLRAGQLSRATGTLEALAKDHDSGEAENLLADAYEQQHRYLDAVRAYQKATELDPQSEPYRFDYIQELIAHRSFDAAMLVGRPAISDFPQSARIALALGVAYFGGGHERESVDVFRSAARKFPEEELPVYFLGLAADATGEGLDEAQSLVQDYARRRPGHYWAYYFLGHRAYLQARSSGSEREFRRARELLTLSIARREDYPESHLDLGNVEAHFHQWRAAIEEYKRAIELKPGWSEVHFRLSQAYLQIGDSTRAQTELATHRRLQARQTEQDMSARVDVFVYSLTRK